ncbi:hypothetical protein KUV50_07450 [Membranicola marinus]|uniref:Uncharacterized protein n=1 Tax=Membranihabitans marinus TaxID=1227546 RepID=A0A953L9T0_9BACT|nr:hypothetical protein [Membranihabitans marinus]MBY5957958.1 hypothetical protein [Membranihabitans marinus]
MNSRKKLSSLQMELLEVFSFEVSDEQVKEIRSLLVEYFADKTTTDVDELFKEKGWGEEKIEEWSKEHMRTEYK